MKYLRKLLLRKKCPYSGTFQSAFCHIRTEYGKPYSVSLRFQSKCEKMRTRMTPNTDNFRAVCFSILCPKKFKISKNGGSFLNLRFEKIKKSFKGASFLLFYIIKKYYAFIFYLLILLKYLKIDLLRMKIFSSTA